MTDIIRQQSPPASSGAAGQYKPEELNADLAAASLAKELFNKLPTPSINTRKFTVINGLMVSLNHREKTDTDPGNLTYLDTSGLVGMMKYVSRESVNEDGKLLNLEFTYLNNPKTVIQGMPTITTQEEEKPGFLSRLWGGITGRNKSQEPQKQ